METGEGGLFMRENGCAAEEDTDQQQETCDNREGKQTVWCLSCRVAAFEECLMRARQVGES